LNLSRSLSKSIEKHKRSFIDQNELDNALSVRRSLLMPTDSKLQLNLNVKMNLNNSELSDNKSFNYNNNNYDQNSKQNSFIKSPTKTISEIDKSKDFNLKDNIHDKPDSKIKKKEVEKRVLQSINQ